ncbi:MAG TPA: hypothetical protein VGO00_13935 [Kofleriaceae bacterium]|nr:hypothetical protein [Kofleriaceae bacterium]
MNDVHHLPDGPAEVDASLPELDAPPLPLAPVCDNLTFTQTPLIVEVNASGQQDAVAGESADGLTVISQRRAQCAGPFALLLTDGLGVLAVTTDITGLPGLAQLDVGREGAVTLTSDGLAVVAVTPTGTQLAMAARTQPGTTDFAPVDGGFGAIVAPVGASLANPVLSADRLALYYQLINAGSGIDGIYESVRSARSVPFPAATRMPANIQTATFVTGISSDRLALFLQVGFAMVVLTRSDLAQPFVNPNAPGEPPSVPGFRTRPLGDCQTLIGTCTGGCLNEETCRFTH